MYCKLETADHHEEVQGNVHLPTVTLLWKEAT